MNRKILFEGDMTNAIKKRMRQQGIFFTKAGI
jgi:hypothetical protein